MLSAFAYDYDNSGYRQFILLASAFQYVLLILLVTYTDSEFLFLCVS